MKRIFLGMIFGLIMLVTACQERKGVGLMPKAVFNLRDGMDKGMEEAVAWSEAIKAEAIKANKVEVLLNQNANRVTLAESERLKYHSKNGYSFHGYAYYEDILILDGNRIDGGWMYENEIYRQKEGRWKKDGRLEEYLGLEKIEGYIQFKKYLIVLYSGDVERQLLLVDMEDWTYKTLATGVGWYYYIHEGRLLYSLEEEAIIMQMELPEGKPEQHEAYRTGEISEGFKRHFSIREDGTMVVVKSSPDVRVSFWLWEQNEEGQWREKKLADWPDGWRYSTTRDYNQRGFIMYVETYPSSPGIRTGSAALQESGEIQQVYISRDCELLIDDSYFTLESLDKTKKWTVAYRYDYEGNKIAEYRLCEQEIIELGFQFRQILYEDGKLTVFYEHELTEELYIAQISI